MKTSKAFPPIPFEDHFHVSKEDMQKILETALSSGGEFSEIFLEYRAYHFVNMEEDIIKETAESISLGMGIRVLNREKTGYGYTNDLSFEKMKKAALSAAAIASSPSPVRMADLRSAGFGHNYYRVEIVPDRVRC